MVEDVFTKVQVRWTENVGEAVVKLSWSYPGQSNIIIPSSHYNYLQYVASSPYTVAISCPPGYSGDTTSNPTE